MELLKQSKNWDMNMSFEKLVKFNPRCRVKVDYKGHWSDSGIEGMCLLMSHPNSAGKSLMEITTSEDGFCYDSDVVEGFDLPFTDTISALNSMHEFLKKQIK